MDLGGGEGIGGSSSLSMHMTSRGTGGISGTLFAGEEADIRLVQCSRVANETKTRRGLP